MDHSRLSLYAKRFFCGTLLSRFSGMVRDLYTAFVFGDHPSVAAFLVALRLSNFFRRLLGEGPFQSAFIPYFEGIKLENEEKSSLFFRQLSLWISSILLLLIVLGEAGIYCFLSYFSCSPGAQEILEFTAWMLPGLLFICLYGLNLSLLHCYETFFIPSIAPVICNGLWILGVFWFRQKPPAEAMIGLSQMVVAGFTCQWLLTLPFAQKNLSSLKGKSLSFSISPEVKQLAKSFSLGALGVGAVQVNTLLDAVFARFADIRGPVYLWYSIRLEQLVLAIFGIACVSTVVPRLSRAIKAGDLATSLSLFSFSYKRILLVMVPASFAIFFLGFHGVNLLYGRGNFSSLAVVETTRCLWAYTLGLIPSTLVILLSSLFYAKEDFKTPLNASLWSIVGNIGLNALFVFGLGFGAISTALATSIASWFNLFFLQHKALLSGWKSGLSLFRIGKLCLLSIFASISVFLMEWLLVGRSSLGPLFGLSDGFSREIKEQLFLFCITGVSFVLVFVVSSILGKMEEVTEFLQTLLPFRSKKEDAL